MVSTAAAAAHPPPGPLTVSVYDMAMGAHPGMLVGVPLYTGRTIYTWIDLLWIRLGLGMKSLSE